MRRTTRRARLRFFGGAAGLGEACGGGDTGCCGAVTEVDGAGAGGGVAGTAGGAAGGGGVAEAGGWLRNLTKSGASACTAGM